MTTSAVLESLADSPPFSLGQRIEVGPSFVVGRAGSSDLPIPPINSVSRFHCIIEYRYQRWWLRDGDSALGVFHNGVRLNPDVELHHEDVVELAAGFPFTFLLPERERFTEVRSEALEAELAGAPDDATKWHVYADWLLERQSVLGEDIVRGYPSAARLGPTLGALAMLHAEGACEIDWKFGRPHRVVLRNPSELWPVFTPQHIVALLNTTPSFRFLRELEIDVRSFGSGARADAYLDESLRALAFGQWRMLTAVRYGPMARRDPLGHQVRSLAMLSAAVPSLSTEAHALFTMQTEAASLEVLTAPQGVTTTPAIGARVALSTSGANLVGGIDECLLVVRGEQVAHIALQVENELDRWWLTDLAARRAADEFGRRTALVRVNGHERARSQLRDGDLIELVPGLRVQFHLPSR